MILEKKSFFRISCYSVLALILSLTQSACMQVVGPELSYENKNTSEKFIGNKRFRGEVQFQEISPTKVKILQEYYICDEFQVKKETLVKKTYSCKAYFDMFNGMACFTPLSAPFCGMHTLYVCAFEAPLKGSSSMQIEEKTECRNKISSTEVVRFGYLSVTINGEVEQELETDNDGVASLNLQKYPEVRKADNEINLKYDYNGHSFTTIANSVQ